MTMPLVDNLLATCRTLSRHSSLPRVSHIYTPPPRNKHKKSRKFGLVVLQDNSTGFFFNLLDDDRRLQQSVIEQMPTDLMELVELYAQPDVGLRALGLGAINALSQFFFSSTGFIPDTASNPLGGFDFSPSDHVGMVGFFPGLVSQLQTSGIPLTVLELDPGLVRQEDRLQVTLDPRQLNDCNKILCTASTLINDTVDDILEQCRQADQVALIGPSTGCIPDPIFDLGITVIGGSLVNDYQQLESRCNDGLDWSDAVTKYTMTRQQYPGFETLLGRF